MSDPRYDFEIPFPSPLMSLLQACETICVTGCCGLDAFDRTPEAIASWVKAEGVVTATHAGQQARELAGDIGSRSGKAYSEWLNLLWDTALTAQYFREWALMIDNAIKQVEHDLGTAA